MEEMKELKNRLAKYLSDSKNIHPLHHYYCATDDHEIEMRTAQDSPQCPVCGAIMTYGKYF